MLYLTPPPTQEIEEHYFKKIRSKIKTVHHQKDSRDHPSYNYSTILTSERIKNILSCHPNDMMDMHTKIMREILEKNSSGNNLYDLYLKIPDKSKPAPNEKDLIEKYDDIIKDLSHIFNYDKYISHSKSTSYALARLLGTNTCVYCNRIYTITVIVKENDEGRITRPEFDHWFAKTKYPIFGLSFYNLIPSCKVCNSSIKGSKDLLIDKHIHPYLKEKGNDFRFSYAFNSTNELSVTIDKSTLSKKAKETIDFFKLEEVYNAHAGLELKDLYDLATKYSDTYLNTLFSDTLDSFADKDKEKAKIELYRMLFGAEYDEDHLHKRPFSKFKKDILQEMIQKGDLNGFL